MSCLRHHSITREDLSQLSDTHKWMARKFRSNSIRCAAHCACPMQYALRGALWLSEAVYGALRGGSAAVVCVEIPHFSEPQHIHYG